MENKHVFQGRLDRDCEICGQPDRHPNHTWPKEETGKVTDPSVPVKSSIVDDNFRANAFEKLKNYAPSSATINNHKWHKRFLEMADHIAQWSHDPSTKCGCVIVDDKQRIVSLGYNGFARGVEDTDERLLNRDLKYELTIHAEINAILFAKRDLVDCTIYITPIAPCSRCAGVIIQSGIKTIVSPKMTQELLERWGASIELSKQMCKEAKVEWIEL